MNGEDADDKQRQKKIKEALFAVRVLPYVALLFVAITADQLIRSAGHWGIEIALRTLGHLGVVMYCFSHWQNARYLLRGETKTPFSACLILGILLMVSGPSMADMYHHKQMALFQTFGIATSVVSVLCLGLILWEIWDAVQKRSAHRNTAP